MHHSHIPGESINAFGYFKEVSAMIRGAITWLIHHLRYAIKAAHWTILSRLLTHFGSLGTVGSVGKTDFAGLIKRVRISESERRRSSEVIVQSTLLPSFQAVISYQQQAFSYHPTTISNFGLKRRPKRAATSGRSVIIIASQELAHT
jgi:hypothetical protein